MSQQQALVSDPKSARQVPGHPIFRFGRFALSLGALCLCGLIAMRFYNDVRFSRLTEEHANTLNDVGELHAQMVELRSQMDSLHQLDRELRSLADLDPIPDEVRKMGVGGAVYEPARPNYGDLSAEAVDRLLREAGLLRESFLEASARIAERAEELAHIPALRPVHNAIISSRYGYRADPFTGRRRLHKGMDFQAPRGTPVTAPADGRVIQANRVAGFGRVIKLDHGNGIITVYGHLSKIRVRNGQQVSRGDLIGDVGSSGRSTSSHLHYEIRVNGRHKDPNSFIIDELAEIK